MENDPTRIVEMNIGHVLKEIRLDAGCTIEQMADIIGVKPLWLVNAEAGNKHISFTRFMRTVATFGGTVIVKTPLRNIPTDAICPIPTYSDEEIMQRKEAKALRDKARTDAWLKRMEKYVDESDGITDNEEQQ